MVDGQVAGRREQRFPTELLVAMDGTTGVARNVSASGIYFETDAEFAEGSAIRFTVEFKDSAGRPLRTECEGRIVRVEKHDGKIGVGAAIHSFKFAVIDGQESKEARPQ